MSNDHRIALRASMPNLADSKIKRDKIKKDTEAFLASGGKVQEIDPVPECSESCKVGHNPMWSD